MKEKTPPPSSKQAKSGGGKQKKRSGAKESKRRRLRIQGCQEEGEMVEFSGPLLSQAHRVDELLEKRDRRIRRAVQKSWFQRGKKE